MGWASWNSFSNTVSSKVLTEQAKALVSSGMRDAGYKYMLIDEGWWLGERDEHGNILVDPQQWPAIESGEKNGDMTNIVRYLHRLGLKAGIYTDAGEFGCSYVGPDIGPPKPHTGSKGHYDRDFLQFARWGFDYVKVDWCGGDKPNLDAAVQYAEIARAVQRAGAGTGNYLFLSICNWGHQSPWTWAPGIGGIKSTIWRTSGDISDPIVDDALHAGKSVTLKNVLMNFDAGIHPEAQHTGYYNDLDMMVSGMRGMSGAWDRIHMSLWAISASPLMMGADLTKLNKRQLATVVNPEVIALDQDPLGLQCIRVSEPGGLEVWAKPLAQPGARAVLLLNRTETQSAISVGLRSIGLDPSSKAEVRDLWARKDLGAFAPAFQGTVPAGDVMLLRISGNDAPREAHAPNPGKRDDTASTGDGADIDFSGIRVESAPTYVRVEYANTTAEPIVAELRANGEGVTKVSFPPTSAKPGGRGAIALEVQFDPKRHDNSLSFSSARAGTSLSIISVELLGW